jgi:hypothetical protein
MNGKEIWEQKSFADLGGAGKERKEALPYYLIPKGAGGLAPKIGSDY